MAPVEAKDEFAPRLDGSQKPFALRRESDRDSRSSATALRENADEPHDIRSQRLISKGIFRLHTDQIASFADHDLRLKRQPAKQLRPELRSRSRLTNDKRSSGTNIDDVVTAQLLCEEARAKSLVPPDIDRPEKNDESHSGHYKEKGRTRLGRTRPAWGGTATGEFRTSEGRKD